MIEGVADTAPLVGMRLLDSHTLNIEVEDRGGASWQRRKVSLRSNCIGKLERGLDTGTLHLTQVPCSDRVRPRVEYHAIFVRQKLL